MISKSISTSVKMSRVSDFAALLYTWLIAHCDDGGNMEGEAMAIKGRVVPMRDVSLQNVVAALDELEINNLVTFYEEKNGDTELEKFIHIIKWENFQTLRADRTDNRFPKYVNQTATKRQPNGNHSLSQDKIREGKIRKDRIGKDTTTATHVAVAKPVLKIDKRSPEIQAIIDTLKELLDGIPMDDTEKENRYYARLLLLKVRKACREQNHPETDAVNLTKNIIKAAFSGWHKKNATSVQYIYRNMGKIIQSSKSKSLNVLSL